MRVEFTKMQGIGNDFVVIDCIRQSIDLSSDDARKIADRRYGVGCDQILLVESPKSNQAAFQYRILNADGSEVGQCGNGARCFARFVYEKQLIDSREFPVETSSGVMNLKILENDQVQVNMGLPKFDPIDIPYLAEQRQSRYHLSDGDEIIEFSTVSMGNPHAVLQVDDINTAPVERLGAVIEKHPDFPERTNVGFMQVIDRAKIQLRVFERGAGETLACGSGACAAMVCGHQLGLLDDRVSVKLHGGDLQVEWDGDQSPVFMTGPAEFVFEGTIQQ